MTKQFWAIIAVVVVIFVGIFIFTGNKSKTGSSSSSSAAQPSQNIIGNNTTGVAMVEYGDFECPYCEEYYIPAKEAQIEFNNQITFQFRNFPLVNVHPNAFAGARAAQAAALQGQFWQMHDALYTSSNWQVWSTANDPTPYFNQYAQQLGLNLSKFQTDFASSQVNDTINADIAAGNKLNVQGTPTFFINGVETSIAPTLADFERVIKAAIAKEAAKTNTSSSSTSSSTSSH